MDCSRHIVQVHVGALSSQYEALSVEASKQTTSEEIVACICERLKIRQPECYELAEVVGNSGGQECKERRLGKAEKPVAAQLLWPKHHNTTSSSSSSSSRSINRGHGPNPPQTSSSSTTNSNNNKNNMAHCRQEFQAPEYRFCLREKFADSTGNQVVGGSNWLEGSDPQLIRDYFLRFLYQPKDKEYPDLCQLPDLNETSMLDNLKARFHNGHIYTYVGSILIALNPFKFYPIYNPKYVKLYQNRRVGDLPPHIFAVADAAYYTMLREKGNQCVVISGESGSGKTESTNLLLHHLTALSQKGTFGSGVEQTILSAGPVLEAFGNAKTAHNNNSSRFGKFIQVNYKENGMVHGAVVQKYLLEKSRIVSQAKKERNYHVFYYMLAGASEEERVAFQLKRPQEYHYLNQSACYTLEGVDEVYEFSRLKQSMEMVGFSIEKQKRLFAVLSAVLHLGNIEFLKKSTYHHDEAVLVKNPELVAVISSLLKVKEETLMLALTTKKARVSGETLVINYRLPEAVAARDALAKCLYGALFDWIVLQLNHALLSKKDARDHNGYSIGVLDIFGFEDFGVHNSFEQFCINFANEHLQHYFNQHVFKYEQEEYKREGIKWKIIDFIDNTGCLSLFEGKPNGLLCILDDQCNFPGATNQTLLQKFNNENKDNEFYEVLQRRDVGFVVKHYAGKVQYNVKDFREKNLDLMRQDIVSVLKNSHMAFVRELVGSDPVAIFRWAILRAFLKGYFGFIQAGQRYRDQGGQKNQVLRIKKSHSGENIHNLNRSGNRRISGNRRPLANVSKQHSEENGPENKSVHNGDSNESNQNSNGNIEKLEVILGANEARVLQRANRILQNRNYRPRGRACKGLKNLQTVKTLAGRTQAFTTGRGMRKQPPTVSAQFQNSLIQLMDTLNNASPFFVRCIKSNAEKIPNKFDEEIVLRQLRYTGMLETVRIRQSGYNVRLSFDEFIQVYRILLPKGLLSSQNDVRNFLYSMNLNRDNYQVGKTKIFMRESEKMKLDLRLHQVILDRIVAIQRWYRVILERRAFLRLRSLVIGLQANARRYLVNKWFSQLKEQWCAAVKIQATWKGYRERKRFQKLRSGILFVQRCFRGSEARNRFKELQDENKQKKKKKKKDEEEKDEERLLHSESVAVSNKLIELRDDTLDSHSPQSDEAFLSKSNSQEELENDRLFGIERPILTREHIDSEESSGIQEDSEADPTTQTEHSTVVVYAPSYLSRSSLPSTHLSSHELSLLSPTKRISQEPRRSIPSSTTPTYELRPPQPNNLEDLLRKPIRKFSVKRSKSARVSATCEQPSIAIKPKITEKVVPKEASSTDNLAIKEPDLTMRVRSDDAINRNPFTRARKHLKGAMEFLGKKNRYLSGEESDESTGEDSTVNAGNHSPIVTPEHSPIDNVSLLENISCASLPVSVNININRTLLTSTYSPTSVQQIQHTFKQVNKFTKADVCLACEKSMVSLFGNGYRCQECGSVVHPRCIQQANKWPCTHRTHPEASRKSRKPIITRIDIPQSGNWNLHRTVEYQDRTDRVISDVMELKHMDEFISKKICLMEESGRKRDTIADVVFKKALRNFKAQLISTYSVAAQEGKLGLKYSDLIVNFEKTMESVCNQEQSSATFPVTMGVNAFRGFMDEFVSRQKTEEKPVKSKKEKRKRPDQSMVHLGHSFVLVVVNIPTACEICSSFMWLMDRGFVCQKCKLTCHKKCCVKITLACKEDNDSSVNGNRLFGVKLTILVKDNLKVPVVVDRLITNIEIKGLYTEGIYRKSGSSSKVRQLKQELEQDLEKVDLDEYPVHVLCTVLKAFFRDMPEPLLTFESYDGFIRATEVSDENERLLTIFALVNKLPLVNYNLVERLIFHLARVAQEEQSNLMSASSLAIVFAPCILRTDKCVNAQDSLNDIAKQTICIQYMIDEQLHKLCNTLADIDTLDMACHKASSRLNSLQSHKSIQTSQDSVSSQDVASETEKFILSQQIESLKNEKVLLTSELPTLKRACSDDDMLSMDMGSSSISSVDELQHQNNIQQQHEEYAVTFDLPVYDDSNA
ncbi:Unconventional myosin-IXAa, variant 2 [Chamberlinius hualienensis]